jgi:hypothetical protein
VTHHLERSGPRGPAAGALLVALLLVTPGCDRKPPPEPEADLGFAVGAVAECRSLPFREIQQGWDSRRAVAERPFVELLGEWAAGSRAQVYFSPDATAGVEARIDVASVDGKAVARLHVKDVDGNFSRTIPLHARRSGPSGAEQVFLYLRARDDDRRTAEVALVAPTGRIAPTSCRELWSLGPVEAVSTGGRPPPGRVSEPTFGGRPVSWWQARLAELRRDGPPELHALALRRAKAAGLTVQERGGAVVVLEPPTPEVAR